MLLYMGRGSKKYNFQKIDKDNVVSFESANI